MDTTSTGRDGRARTAPTAALLFCSGLCALVLQSVWLREFRLVFGASTAASAAVLAIFMGGVGAGGMRLGRRADRAANPLRMYALLELGVAATAAVTPALLGLVRVAYVATGGTPALGHVAGSALRLVLAAVVLAAPTFLMGGTLPAAVRAVECARDASRRRAALLYGTNTLGAVAGALLATFVLVEALGDRLTLWSACALNVAVALAALRMSRGADERAESAETSAPQETESDARAAPRRFVLAAAAVSGFAFFLMEIVWYRMLGPLLGGSTYTFGLILAVALAGIALGSLASATLRRGRPATTGAFAFVCALQAFFVAVPYALGDRLMVFTAMLQPLGAPNLAMRALQWSATTAIVVGPAAVLAGVQFPLLIALLGRGRDDVGADTGRAYAWNTAGAIVGSLAGGFGLLPALGAPVAWMVVVELLVALSACALLVGRRGRSSPLRFAPAALAGAAALALLTSVGPTAAWRHSPVGAGRLSLNNASANDVRAYVRQRRRELLWQAEGVESCVGVTTDGGYSFVVNGKSDGAARTDASTQVMLGLLPAFVHPAPKDALVIGLGTGSTAGWLADVPTIERVDVAELEPVIADVAEICAPVNRDVLRNPKVHLWFGDGREALLAGERRYDVIASEPSNPYRAGVAALYTREFYEAAERRLREHGLFAQWVQGYEVDGGSVRGVYATMSSVFPCVETWQTASCDLLFIASREPLVHDVARLRDRMRQEPYRSAFAQVWRMTDVEGVFGHFVANRGLAAAAALDAEIDTDDRNELEFAFARTVGRPSGFDVGTLARLATERGFDQPETKNGTLDASAVADRRVSALVVDGQAEFESGAGDDDGRRARTAAKSAYAKSDFAGALAAWSRQTKEPADLIETLLVAHGAAATGDARAARFAEQLGAWIPHEAEAMTALSLYGSKRPRDAFALAQKALRGYRADPWPRAVVMATALAVAKSVALSRDMPPAAAAELMETLSKPFAVNLLAEERTSARLELAARLDEAWSTHLTRDVVDEFEPNAPWVLGFLRLRADAYEKAGDPRAASAKADVAAFEAGEPRPFALGVRENETATSR